MFAFQTFRRAQQESVNQGEPSKVGLSRLVRCRSVSRTRATKRSPGSPSAIPLPRCSRREPAPLPEGHPALPVPPVTATPLRVPARSCPRSNPPGPRRVRCQRPYSAVALGMFPDRSYYHVPPPAALELCLPRKSGPRLWVSFDDLMGSHRNSLRGTAWQPKEHKPSN
jgi:hypothetical protein